MPCADHRRNEDKENAGASRSKPRISTLRVSVVASQLLRLEHGNEAKAVGGEKVATATVHRLSNSSPIIELNCYLFFAYPLAIPVMAWFAWGLARGVKSANAGTRVLPEDISDTVNLGHRAALIGGTFWTIAGVIYPLALWWMYPDFTTTQAVHFFVSLLVCGGVAMVYPFFGMALISTLVYYPLLVRGSMQDDHFDTRARQMIRRSEVYLLMAVFIPLVGAALIISSESQSKGFMLTAIAAGMTGLLAAFFAFRLVSGRWSQMSEVLSSRSSVVPGENDGISTSAN